MSRTAPAKSKREGPERAHRLAAVRDELPLYPTEAQIARHLLGPGSEEVWAGMATVLERHGLPMIDAQMGRRFWPAVVAYFYRRAGIGNMIHESARTDLQEYAAWQPSLPMPRTPPPPTRKASPKKPPAK